MHIVMHHYARGHGAIGKQKVGPRVVQLVGNKQGARARWALFGQQALKGAVSLVQNLRGWHCREGLCSGVGA